ncbi:MAG: metallophosphoesterase [Vicinamibacterales bacterium]
MRLLAISDLHLGHPANRAALSAVPEHAEDWLIVAGDVGETLAHMELAWRTLVPRFARVLWTPGNHELWTAPSESPALRGVAKYDALVDVCRSFGVATPDDPFARWPGEGPPTVVAPIFLLYDYSFRPDDVPEAQALAWAEEHDLVCADEVLLHPDPYPSRGDWCRERVRSTAGRLDAIPRDHRVVLVNHFPLRYDLVHLPRIPRFSIWCGTRLTDTWHVRYPVSVVVSGHLHVRSTEWRDGVRFEEVSLGYPRQWRPELGIAGYLRRIL